MKIPWYMAAVGYVAIAIAGAVAWTNGPRSTVSVVTALSLGPFIGFAVSFTLIWVWTSLWQRRLLVDLKVPHLPLCRSGKCRGNDYEIETVTSYEFVWKCKCGDRYDLKRGRVFLVGKNGDRSPYKRWVPFCKWVEMK